MTHLLPKRRFAPALLAGAAAILLGGCPGGLWMIGGPGEGGADGGAAAACANGARDGDETDVDCGGRCGATCTFGQRCRQNADCSVGACAGGACTPTGSTCFDHAQDGPETDVDCGGGCPKCKDGRACVVAADCASGTCTGGRCAAGKPPFDFATARFADVKAQGPVALVAADFDGDGRADVAVSGAQSKEVAVALGNGDGTLARLARFPIGDAPSAIAAADWNRDGRPDLVVGQPQTDAVVVLMASGPGQGPFTMKVLPPLSACNGPRSVTPADLDGDALPDLVVGCISDGRLAGLRGAGDGTFKPAGGATPIGRGVWWAAAGDFTSDGKTDVAALADYQLVVAAGDGAGGLSAMGAMPTDGGKRPWSILAADLDKDGRLDLVTASYEGFVYGLRGKGDGTFTAPAPYNLGGSPWTLAAADFDGDGRLDVVTANTGASSLQVLRGRGDGTFEPAQGFYVGGTMQSVTVGDFNGDGKPDLALCDYWTHDVGVMLNRSGT